MLDIVTIGTATKDIYLRSKDFVISENLHFPSGRSMAFEAGSKIEVEKVIHETGGGATNTAITFARLGLKTACCCEIGNDLAGRDIVKILKKNRVKTYLINTNKNSPTSLSVIFLSKEGERNIFVYRGALIDENEIKVSRLRSKWFYLSSVGGNIKLLNKIVDFVENKKIKLAFNPGSKELELGLVKLSRIFNATDILILNRSEASDLMGISYNFRKTIFRKACGLTPGIEVITDGKNGAYATDDEKGYRIGIYNWKIVDRLGAGDAFGSGFVAGYINYKQDIKKALQYAAANASSVVTQIGAKKGIIKSFPSTPLKVEAKRL